MLEVDRHDVEVRSESGRGRGGGGERASWGRGGYVTGVQHGVVGVGELVGRGEGAQLDEVLGAGLQRPVAVRAPAALAALRADRELLHLRRVERVVRLRHLPHTSHKIVSKSINMPTGEKKRAGHCINTNKSCQVSGCSRTCLS